MKKELELRSILDPPYNWLFSKLAQVQQDGVKFLCDIRADVLKILLESTTLPNNQRLAMKTMTGHLKDLLGHWFSAGLMDLEQVKCVLRDSHAAGVTGLILQNSLEVSLVLLESL